jgi:hypothetical protein
VPFNKHKALSSNPSTTITKKRKKENWNAIKEPVFANDHE